MLTKKKIYTGLLLFIILVLIWVRFSHTPFIWDDIWYHFSVSPDFRESGNLFSVNRITTVGDWIESLKRFGHVHIWRIGNILMLLFTNIGSKHLLDILHTLVFGVFIITTCKLCLSSITVRNLGITLLSILFLIPHLDRVLFWSAGAFNYFWGAMFLSLLLFLTQRQAYPHGVARLIVVCILSFLCGGMHEALGLPLLAYFGCLATIQIIKEKYLSRDTLLCFICTAAGILIPFSSPGLYTRAASPSLSTFCSDLVYSICIFILNCAVPLFVSIVAIIRQRSWDYRKASYLLMAVIFSLPGLVFASKGYWGGAYFYPSLAMMFFALSTLQPGICTKGKALSFISWCAVFATAGISCTRAYTDYQQYSDTIRKAAQERVIIRDEYTEENTPGWHLRNSLPGVPDRDYNTDSIARLFELPLFSVGYNIYSREINAATAFADNKDDAIQAIRQNQFIIVRLPRHMILHYGRDYSSSLILDQGESRHLRYPWDYKHRHILLHLVRGSSHANFGMDYQNEHVYLIIKDETKSGKALHLILLNWQTGQIAETTIPVQESS